MDALQVLEQVESASGTNEKIAILKAHKDNKELAELLDAALNFKRKFFIKKFETQLSEGPCCIADHESFILLLNVLENREVTGNGAINAVEHFFEGCEEIEAKWYSRVLRKDLRCNISISTVNKAGFNIPEFDVMLAKDGKETKNLKDIVSKGVYVSPKFDGYRCIAVCDHGEVQLFSRNGSEYENFPSVKESLSVLSKDLVFVLDGEIMSDDFNKMQQSAFASVRGTTVGDVKFNVFGWIDFNEWKTGEFKIPTNLRLKSLSMFFEINKEQLQKLGNIVEVQHKLVYSVEDIIKLEQEFMAEGFEGAMALPNIPYYLGKKTGRLMKFKTMLSQDCKVVGMYEGLGKYEGTMGGLKVIQENGVSCDIGSGFTDEDRDYMWNNQDKIIGRTLEAKYQELTPDSVMRFPVFIRWRNDK